MKLDTFYRIDGTKLIETPHGEEGYPLENQQWEPTAYIDEEDGYPYVSGFFSGDHRTFATNEDFGINPLLTINDALTFLPTIESVEALLDGSHENSYLYLSEVHSEVTNTKIISLYNLVLVKL